MPVFRIRLRRIIVSVNRMNLNIRHETHYQYTDECAYAVLQIRLRPVTTPVQNVLDWTIELEGAERQARFWDHNHNQVELITLMPGASQLRILATGQVETTDTSGIIGQHSGRLPLWYFQRQTSLTRPGQGVSDLLDELGSLASDPISGLHRLSQIIRQKVAYCKGRTSPHTDAEAALDLAQGVCQDHTHIFLSAVRALGFPARYVSGYLMIKDTPDQEAGHAWAEVYLEDLGWVGFDISNGISPDAHYVHIARGLDYYEASPTRGVQFGAPQSDMSVCVQVQQ